MLQMLHHKLKKHKYKIALGIPVVLLLASSLSLSRDAKEMCIIAEDNRYVEVGEVVTLHLTAKADSPINVIGATLQIPTDYVAIEAITQDESIIDLWSEEPILSDSGLLHFSGGIITDTGFSGEGRVLTLVTKPRKEGVATITFTESTMLAHDGTGVEVACETGPITLTIRPASFPSPDVNDDGHITIADFGLVSAKLFGEYERTYDLNLDGKITLSDLGVLFSTVGSTSKLGSLAVLWK